MPAIIPAEKIISGFSSFPPTLDVSSHHYLVLSRQTSCRIVRNKNISGDASITRKYFSQEAKIHASLRANLTRTTNLQWRHDMDRSGYCRTFFVLCPLTRYHQPIYARDGPLAQCRHYYAQIEYYTALRRNGGSGKNMEQWRQLRHDLKQRYDRLQCRKWADKITQR